MRTTSVLHDLDDATHNTVRIAANSEKEMVVAVYTLSEQEVESIQQLSSQLKHEIQDMESSEAFLEISVIAQELPRSLRRFVREFTCNEPEEGVCLISGYFVNDRELERTPRHWSESSRSTVAAYGIYLFMLSSLFGEVFGWATQQGGRLIHDIAPTPGHEKEQISSGSEDALLWHTEDAFHPYRADYVGLMCLRNPGKTATTVAHLDCGLLSAAQIEILRQPRFHIWPDGSHMLGAVPVRGGNGSRHRPQVVEDEMAGSNLAAALFGIGPPYYLRVDPCFMKAAEGDDEAQAALDCIIDILNRSTYDVFLRPGDCCFLDNYRVVHGRRPFKASHDGHDRWLKRVNITRDFRKARCGGFQFAARILL